MERIFGRKITAEDVENVADKMAVKVQKGIKYVSEDLKKRRVETQARDKELKDIGFEAYKKGYAQRVYREAAQPRAISQPVRVKYVQPARVVRPRLYPMYTLTHKPFMTENFGAEYDIINSPSPIDTGSHIVGTRRVIQNVHPVNDARSQHLVNMRKKPSGGFLGLETFVQ